MAFASELGAQVLTGAMSDDAWREEVVRRLGREYGTLRARQGVAAWSRVGVIDPDVLGLVRAVRRSTQVWLATNATSRLPWDLATLGLDRELDGVVNSSAVRAMKPAEAFFRAAIGFAGPVALFVDDSPGHCEAARALGLAAHRFQTAGLFEATLHEVGLLT